MAKALPPVPPQAGELIVMAAFWAYTIIDYLIKEFSKNVTHIDLGVIFVFGLISSIDLGLAFAFRRELVDITSSAPERGRPEERASSRLSILFADFVGAA